MKQSLVTGRQYITKSITAFFTRTVPSLTANLAWFALSSSGQRAQNKGKQQVSAQLL